MIEKIPIRAFGKTFTHLPEEARHELRTLERESAVYLDHWIDEIGDFRHVKIVFTETERLEYARRTWAYELFLRSGARWARDVLGIDHDIALDADSYSLRTVDGSVFPPPCHCYAAFLGEHLESLVCGWSDREIILELHGQEASLFEVKRAVQTITATIRSFNTRERTKTVDN